ncbi:MAG: ATP-binding cassette domain-containing protein [Deltaproteobacteria bacterium]|nr:ATP-binding cassette domain-containing protein [Deltaproteobacteria bacterium]
MPALEVRKLTKMFDLLKAVDTASFEVPEGSIFGLIGRNGAGKTTTIRMLMNIYMPTSGEILFRGRPVDHEFRARVGYLPEERGLYKKMKVLETILFFAELKGLKGKDATKKAKEYLERFELTGRINSKLETLSKGNQQKVQFISTIIHDPDFIVLDEPFSGLDPINTNLLKEIILEKKRDGKVIIFSTHLMDFAERLCDNIAMIDKGKIILNGDLNTIKADFSKNNVKLTYEGDIFFLDNHPIIDHISDFGNSVGISLNNPGQTQELLRLLIEHNVKIISFDSANISLNEIFIKLAGSPAKEDLNLA